MIPKIIHYCWFGGNPLPESAIKCIESWRKFMPDYQIKEWNEQNFDVNIIPYTRQAYEAGKYAFVSDYARFWILYRYGGLYFDTDVEVIRPLDDIVEKGAFMGCEIDADEYDRGGIAVAPGLGMAANAGNEIYKVILDRYANLHFVNQDGSYNISYAVVKLTTDILREYGLNNSTGIQYVNEIYIYPKCYFNPFDDATGRLNITQQTRTIHWYSKTWLKVSPLRQYCTRLAHRIFGVTFFAKLKRSVKIHK